MTPAPLRSGTVRGVVEKDEVGGKQCELSRACESAIVQMLYRACIPSQWRRLHCRKKRKKRESDPQLLQERVAEMLLTVVLVPDCGLEILAARHVAVRADVLLGFARLTTIACPDEMATTVFHKRRVP